MRVNFSEVQRNVSEIANRQQYTIDVLYELMAAYGRSASSITKLRNGVNNLATDKNTTVLQRGVVYFKIIQNTESLPAQVEKLEQDPLTQRYNPRFLIATDLKNFAAKDTKKGNTLEIAWADIDRYVDFFYGWTGDEVTSEKTEAVADRRAADKMKELYQEVEKVNVSKFKKVGKGFRHDLNVFFTRLLFCFFAEDTGVFSKENRGVFTGAIRDYTQVDGSDLDQFLGTLFESLDEENKSTFTSPFSMFPYVNGRLFDKDYGIEIPKFNAQARHLILECGALSWAEINPDIFGSMFQSIVDEEQRATHGMHYTSVPNIMKTIEPLFLDDLREEFDKHYDDPKKLQNLHERISKIKIFDPACGSGNFLIIAYKELRKLEHAIIERLFEDEYVANQLKNKLQSRIDLNNFYGIEIDDFACEVAVLSLYLAKHQMNIEFEKHFGREIKLIPLKDKANIVHGNAARLDWQEVCSNKPTKRSFNEGQQQQLIATDLDRQQHIEELVWEEIYLISNPPYQGGKKKSLEQKIDYETVFDGQDYSKNLDYISLWFVKGARYISGSSARLSFVSTNSVVQGEHIANLWPFIYELDIEIFAAYTSFKWTNNAKDAAAVTCVIVFLQDLKNRLAKEEKKIYTKGVAKKVDNINAYLVDAKNIIVYSRSKPLSELPTMVYGNMPLDGNFLKLTIKEKNEIIKESPLSKKFIRPMVGGKILVDGGKRYCLWIEDADLGEARKNVLIEQRINNVKEFRLSGGDVAKTLAGRSHQFRYRRVADKSLIAIPRTTTANRIYIPCAVFSHEYVTDDSVQVLYDAPLYVFSIISSQIHMAWMRQVGGRLQDNYRYSALLVYNNFPLRKLTTEEQTKLTESAQNILFIRENHTEKTLAEMYDPDKMPEDLKAAHHTNDLLVDRLYRQKPYANDEERLADLFKLYEEMIATEKK